jgi:hypothetical protein
MLRLSREEYEAVRAHPRRFLIVPGHTFAHGRVVQRTERFAVIEKVGDAGELAEELDPRRDTPSHRRAG